MLRRTCGVTRPRQTGAGAYWACGLWQRFMLRRCSSTSSDLGAPLLRWYDKVCPHYESRTTRASAEPRHQGGPHAARPAQGHENNDTLHSVVDSLFLCPLLLMYGLGPEMMGKGFRADELLPMGGAQQWHPHPALGRLAFGALTTPPYFLPVTTGLLAVLTVAASLAAVITCETDGCLHVPLLDRWCAPLAVTAAASLPVARHNKLPAILAHGIVCRAHAAPALSWLSPAAMGVFLYSTFVVPFVWGAIPLKIRHGRLGTLASALPLVLAAFAISVTNGWVHRVLHALGVIIRPPRALQLPQKVRASELETVFTVVGGAAFLGYPRRMHQQLAAGYGGVSVSWKLEEEREGYLD